MHRLVIAVGLTLTIGGCFSPVYHNGNIRCTQDRQCQSGYHCAVDATCWKNNEDPPIVQGTVTPAAVWISSGGGALSGTDTSLNISVSGSFATGTITTAAASSPTITLGYLASDTN